MGVNRWMGVCENGRVGSAKDLPEGRRAGLVAAVATAVEHELAADGSMPKEDLAGRREDETRREATVEGF